LQALANNDGDLQSVVGNRMNLHIYVVVGESEETIQADTIINNVYVQ